MKPTILSLTLVLLVASFAVPAPTADVPELLPFQGRLVDAAGIPVTATGLDVTFNIHTAPLVASSIYTETQTLDVVDGIVSTQIGLVTPLSTVDFSAHENLYLGLTFGTDAEMTPRIQLGASAYSLRADKARHAEDVEGMDINPHTLAIDGLPVIASDGTWVGPPMPSAIFGTGTANPGTDAFVSGLDNEASGDQAAVLGGVSSTASGAHAVVLGGEEGLASGLDAIVAGGHKNESSGAYSFTAGRSCTASADYAFALGRRASALHEGSFVWASAPGVIGAAPELASTAPGQFLIEAPGGVGIGTNSPSAPLHVIETGMNPFGEFYTDDVVALFRNDAADSSTGVGISAHVGRQSRIYFSEGSNLGFLQSYDHAEEEMSFSGAGATLDTPVLTLRRTDREVYVGGTHWSMSESGGGDFRIRYGPPGASSWKLRVGADGVVDVCTLKITGGCDLVEGFDAVEASLEPGTVVVIDPEHPGKLTASTEAYDRKVAGVVSGAGGVTPGIELSQEGVLEGEVPVAMTGRVYVRCTAENGPIVPGDRLTTSSVAGLAMKATDRERCDGAVLGKAMSALEDGTGLVLVLVNLQ